MYGQAGLKFSGQGAHDIRAVGNLYAYVDTAFNGNAGHFRSFASADGWFVNNTVIMGGDSSSYFGAGYPSDCVLVGQPARGQISGNTIHTKHPLMVPCLNDSSHVLWEMNSSIVHHGDSFTQQPWLPWTVKQGNLVAGLTTFPSPKGCKPVVNGSWDPTSNCVWVADKLSPSWQACQASCGKNRACNSFDFATSWTI